MPFQKTLCFIEIKNLKANFDKLCEKKMRSKFTIKAYF